MTKFIQVYCKNIGRYIDVEGGDSLLDLYGRLAGELSLRPVCALVNNKTEALSFPIFAPKEVEFLDRTTPHGRNVYTRSLCMMLYKAALEAAPGLVLQFEHSISKGNYCRLLDEAGNPVKADEALVDKIRTRLREITAADIPFVSHA